MVWLRLVAAVRREGSAQCNGIGVDNGITAGFGGGGHGEESIIQKRRNEEFWPDDRGFRA